MGFCFFFCLNISRTSEELTDEMKWDPGKFGIMNCRARVQIRAERKGTPRSRRQEQPLMSCDARKRKIWRRRRIFRIISGPQWTGKKKNVCMFYTFSLYDLRFYSYTRLIKYINIYEWFFTILLTVYNTKFQGRFNEWLFLWKKKKKSI